MRIFVVFALGLMVSLVILKGVMQANDYIKQELEKRESSVKEQASDKQ